MPKISGLPPIANPADDDVLAIVDDDATTTKKWSLANVKIWLQGLTDLITTSMITDRAVTASKIDYTTNPMGQMTYSSFGVSGGQVIAVTTATDLIFDVLTKNSNTVVTKQSNGIMKVSEAGWYLLVLNVSKVDVNSDMLLKFQYSTDNSTYYDVTEWSNQQNIPVNRSLNISAIKYMDADSYVKSVGYTYTQTRIAADSANEKQECSFTIVRVG